MTTLSRGRQLFLTFFVCSCLCGGAFAQAAGGAASSSSQRQQAARVVEKVSAPQGWQRYEIHYAGGHVVRAVLPAQPEVSSAPIPMPLPNFPPATQYVYTSADDHGVYIVGYLEGLPEALTADPRARDNFFAGLWKGMADGMSAELKRQGVESAVTARPLRRMDMSGHQAQVQDFSVGALAGSARAVLAGANSYLFINISFGHQLNDQGNSFLNSLEIGPKR